MVFLQHISFLNQYIKVISIEKPKHIRNISYSMISRSDNEEELMKYIRRQIEPDVNMELGKKIHGNFSGDEVSINIDYITHIKDNKVFLCPHTISESYLINMSILRNTTFQSIAYRAKDFEMKYTIGLQFGRNIYSLVVIIDLYNKYQNRIIELKTTNSTNITTIIDKYKYDMQLALYSYVITHVLNNCSVTIVFVSKQIPYRVYVKHMSDSMLMKGAVKLVRYLRLFEMAVTDHNLLDLFLI